MSYIPTFNGWFSGAGGLDLGLCEAGLRPVQSLEYDKQACQTLRLNFNHSVCERDIRVITVKEQPSADVHAFTFPCTKYSTAADLHGTRTGDDLFLHAFRHMVLGRPEAYVVENVPGMLKFPVVMEAMSQLPDYFVNIFCPIDALTWLPQKRKRLILIGTRRPFFINQPSAGKRIQLMDIIESDPQIEIPDYVYTRMNGGYRDMPIISDPNKNDVAPTCVAHYSKDRGTRMVADNNFKMGARPYTVREYARLQGFPDWFQFSGSDSDAYKQIGNAVAVPMARWIGHELMRYFN